MIVDFLGISQGQSALILDQSSRSKKSEYAGIIAGWSLRLGAEESK